MLGLLDSGATVSCLGGNDMYWNERKNYHSKSIEVYVTPSLSQDVYLANKFCRDLKLEFHIISETSITECNENALVLTPDQTRKLNAAVLRFPSYEENGLGKTSLIENDIDVGIAKAIMESPYPVYQRN